MGLPVLASPQGGFAVEREDGSPGDGTTFWAARRIRIPPDLSSGQAAWAHPVIANGKLYVQDMDFLLCYDIKLQ